MPQTKDLLARSPRVALALAVLAAVPANAAPLPLDLVDPANGKSIRVAAGPLALHVVFFATWCSPCTAELADLSDLETRWREDGYRLVVVAVASRHTAERLARHADEHEIPGQFLFDASGAAQRALLADGLPSHVVFDHTGQEVARSGRLDSGIRDAVAQLVRGAPGGRARP